MADITLNCTVCSRTLTVSEFVDRSAVRCPSCGGELADGPAQSAESGLRLKHKPEPEPPRAQQQQQETAPSRMPERLALWLGPAGWRSLLPVAHWAVFLVLILVLRGVFRLRFETFVQWALGG